MGASTTVPEMFFSLPRRRREERGNVLEAGLLDGVLHVVFFEAPYRSLQDAPLGHANEAQ